MKAKRGLMIFHRRQAEWTLWAGQSGYCLGHGDFFEIRIGRHYHEAYFETVPGNTLTLDGVFMFEPNTDEIYPVRFRSGCFPPLLTLG